MTESAQTDLPKGHNSVNGFIAVRGAQRFIAFVCEVFDGSEHKDRHIPDRDGTLIHAEVQIGNATIMLFDSKDDWPPTLALTQVYVADAQLVLDRAVTRGGRVVTEVSPFWGGVKLARFADPWDNLWWLFEPGPEPAKQPESTTDWHKDKPSYAYTTIMEEMARRGRK